MILLKQNVQDYNNDLRSMLMAFFPGEKIEDYDKAIKHAFVNQNGTDEEKERLVLWTFFEVEKTYLALLDNPDKLLDADTVIKNIIKNGRDNTVIAEGDYKNRKSFRNHLKLSVYRLLSEYTGRKLPWGDLTGVRPTKIAMKKIREGKTRNEVVDYYKDTYDTDGSKAKLSFDVADKELKLIKDIDLKNSYCLYVGIPFCPSRCLYCSFTAYAIALHDDKVDRYIERLCEEITYVAEKYKDKRLVSIYMGGGTPTSINYEQMDRLLAHIDSTLIKADKLLEYTIEAGRPDSITKEKLLVMKKHNVTRISINPQTMNDATLKTIGRAHTVEDVEYAFSLARECGFDNINMDLIAGLPGEDKPMMQHTLDKVKELKPESLTVHSLAIKRAAKLNEKMDEYKADINHDVDEMLDMVSRTAAELSMEPYYLYRQKNIGGNLENVGYSVPGKECIYNVLIMEELTDIIAVGAGSSSKYVIRDEKDNVIRIDRSENCKSIDDYIDRFDEMIDRKR
ncbi:MAG: coproporphyrinogen dehydrogenase HemZ [Lachnospiraceae bacterium]|nr:coproporphyrinogen dehydrogenase HemZ [Lachnospiraceae bacterium]MBQ9608433.1 coproporphyrinogen dehydrogenase HemZ [Lachnospiraceae bacterium]